MTDARGDEDLRHRTSVALDACRDGAPEALFAVIYPELRALARAYLFRERQGHSYESAGLVNEAFVRLVGSPADGISDRAHFFRIAARAMRRVLVDHSRQRDAEKRGGDLQRVTLSVADALPGTDEAIDVVEIGQALDRLAELDEELGEVAALRVLTAATEAEVAEAMGCSDRTVRRQWRKARAWLTTELAG